MASKQAATLDPSGNVLRGHLRRCREMGLLVLLGDGDGDAVERLPDLLRPLPALRYAHNPDALALPAGGQEYF